MFLRCSGNAKDRALRLDLVQVFFSSSDRHLSLRQYLKYMYRLAYYNQINLHGEALSNTSEVTKLCWLLAIFSPKVFNFSF